MKSARAREAVLLILIAAGATAAVLVFSERTLPRAMGGIVLALAPWWAASRLEIVRRVDLPGGRLAAAGGIGLAALVLLGLVLTVTNIGLTATSAAIGTAAIAIALTLAGQRAGGEPWRFRPSLLGSALTLLATAIVVVAFALARGGALESAREGSGYAAFVVAGGRGQQLGLRNATERDANFTIRIAGADRRRTTILGVAPGQVRLLPVPKADGELEIRVVVRVGGRQKGRALTLSASPLS